MIALATACLALTIYNESRGESNISQQYVAHVVLNRSVDYENESVCSAVFDKSQFSWTNNIKHSSQAIIMVKRALKKIDDPESWSESVKIAKKIMSRKHDITNGAKFFNERKMGVRYKTKVKPVILGKHIYY
jgi:spore germination cell wall hydrolase CwlJ-like protein